MSPSLPPDLALPVYSDRTSEQSESGWQFSVDEESLPKQPHSRWSRLLSLVPATKSQRGTVYHYQAAPTEDGVIITPSGEQRNAVPLEVLRLRIVRLWRRAFLRLPFLILMGFGILHIILVVLGRKSLLWDHAPGSSRHRPNLADHSTSNYPTDATRDVIPIPCHSHNDYWRNVPLFDALQWGCFGVEADVWLIEGHEDLFVGHNMASLTNERTFRSLYVDPLVKLLDGMNPSNEFGSTTNNGVFDSDPKQPLILLVDFKTDGHDLFSHVEKQLEPLREKNHLTHWNGNEIVSRAITVVGTGNTPFDLVVANSTYRDMFFDAPLDAMWEPLEDHTHAKAEDNIGDDNGDVDYDTLPQTHQSRSAAPSPSQGKSGTSAHTSPDDFDISNSYYASVSFLKTIGLPFAGRLSNHQLEKIRNQIRGAQRQGLKVRYWETPAWPTSLRNYIWTTLVNEGVDMLNVDDLEAAATMDWTKRLPHGMFDA